MEKQLLLFSSPILRDLQYNSRANFRRIQNSFNNYTNKSHIRNKYFTDMFETSFNIRNTQVELSNELCITPSRSYTKPKTAQKITIVKKRESIRRLMRSFHIEKKSTMVNEKHKSEIEKKSKKSINYNLLRIRKIYSKKAYKSTTWNEHKHSPRDLLVNSQKKILSHKYKSAGNKSTSSFR